MGVWGYLELIHLPGWLMGEHGASCGPSVAMKNHAYPLSLFSHPLTCFILGWSPCLHKETPSATGLSVSLILHLVWAHLTGSPPFCHLTVLLLHSVLFSSSIPVLSQMVQENMKQPENACPVITHSTPDTKHVGFHRQTPWTPRGCPAIQFSTDTTVVS